MIRQALRGILLIALLVSCTVFHVSAQRKLPSVTVKALDGKTTDMSTISNNGKPIVLFTWEITCQPCISEFNAIAPLYKDWKQETGVKIVAVSVDDNRSSPRVQPMVRSKGWGFEVYLDPNQAFKRAMNVTYCPYVFVLNGKGEVVWQKGGYTPGDETVIYDIVKKVAKGEAVE